MSGLGRGDYLGEHDSGSGFHVCVQVDDMERALGFYRDLLGLEVAWSHQFSGEFLDQLARQDGAVVDVVHLAVPGGSRIELARYHDQDPTPERTLAQTGLNHLCLGVRDMDATYRRLSGAGVPFAAPPVRQSAPGAPVDHWWVAYCYDPWGTPIELFSPDAALDDDPRLF